MNSEKLKTVIIDDEKLERYNLKAILADYFDDIQVIDEADRFEFFHSIIREGKNPDLVFFDIELCLSTGIELLSLVKNPSFEVVFITAYEDYAAKVSRTIATDYLLKPIDIDELR